MVDKEECFVICPIGETDSDTRKHSDLTFNYIIKPVVEEFGYSPNRADLVKESGMITTQIIDKIIKSPLVIADLTDSNPNVFYELAIRHVVKKPYIQMIKSNQDIPFDISGMRTILFDVDLEQAESAKKELREHIESIQNNNFKPVNPVTHARSYSVVQKMLDDNTNNESGDISKVVLKSVSEISSMMAEMRLDIHHLKRTSPSEKYVSEEGFDLRELKRLESKLDFLQMLKGKSISENKDTDDIIKLEEQIKSTIVELHNLKNKNHSRQFKLTGI